MITFLRGNLIELLPTRVVLEVTGVGYEVFIPLSTYDQLPAEGQEAFLLTHLAVREDAHTLYGFASKAERDLFRLLVERVSGIGPKVALAILSGMPIEQFQSCVVRGDIAALARIKGLGKKTAERVVVELKDKIGVASAWEQATKSNEVSPASSDALQDAVLGLIALGYRGPEAQQAVLEVMKKDEVKAPEQLIREALKILR